MRSLLVLALGAGALTTSIAVAAAEPEPLACAVAYRAAAQERGRSRTDESRGLIARLPNADSIDFDARAEAMSARFGVDGLDARLKAGKVAEDMKSQAHAAGAGALPQPQVANQAERESYALIRACDTAYGFTPVLDEPPAAAAALDDTQCAVRFWIVAVGSAGNPQVQQAMAERLQVAADKVIAAQPGMTKERLAEILKSEGQARGQNLQDKSWSFDELLADVNACEARYGIPVTTKNPD